jgi:DNA mismatch repair protein MutL
MPQSAERGSRVCALPDGFEIIDQHALHERITYECLRAELAQGQCERQRLLLPELVELSRDEAVLVAAHVEDLASLGFELQPFGGETTALHSYPARLERPRAAELVRAIAAALQEGRSLSRERLMEEVLHRAACRASVMAGDELEQEEMRVLLERGRALESDQTCVHGRPTRIRFTLADLERAFLRRV